MLFNVKIVTRHQDCRRVCLVDVIAKCGADAAKQAISMARPVMDIDANASMSLMWSPAQRAAK